VKTVYRCHCEAIRALAPGAAADRLGSPQNGPLKAHIVAKINGFVVELEKYEHRPSKNACSRSFPALMFTNRRGQPHRGGDRGEGERPQTCQSTICGMSSSCMRWRESRPFLCKCC
jgi:hypothetical protein